MRFKKAIAVMLVLCMSITVFSACPTTIAQTTNLQIDETEQITLEQAELLSTLPETDEEVEIFAYTNVAVDVKWAPVWTSPTIETFSAGKTFNIIHKEYDYYYIEYEDSNHTLKRGYILRSCTSTVVSKWCNHNIFTAAWNNKGVFTYVYSRPYSNKNIIDSIDSDEGEAENKPLIVLSRLGNYFYVQYVGNPDGGGVHMQWKRGWVYAPDISLYTLESISQISGKTTFYIQNVGTGRFLTLEDPNAANNSDLIIQDFEGSARQKWTLEVSETSLDTAKYVTIKTEAGTSSTDRIMAIENKLSVVNTRMEIQNKGTPPGKHQEFYIKDSGYTSYGQTEYNICSRLTGNYMQLGVYHDQQGNGGPVLNKYPYTTWYNRWRLIPTDARLVKLVCDTTCTKTDAEIETAFKDAVLGFKYGFNLDFRILSISRESFSNGLSCPYTSSSYGCNDDCGNKAQCGQLHHKGSVKLMGTTPITNYYTFKFVGHGLCNYRDGKHGDVNGTGYIPEEGYVNYCAIASTLKDINRLPTIIQHELSHNLGAYDEQCVPGSNCVMSNSQINTWCLNCESLIKANIRTYN